MVKTCNCCKEEKSISEFHKHPSGTFGVRGTCKFCILNKKDRRNKQLKQRYGINIQEYNRMFEKQKGCCAICGTHQSQLNVTLAVDHSHKSMTVRGLLCYNCNCGLGRFKDDISLFMNAIEYLKSSSTTTYSP